MKKIISWVKKFRFFAFLCLFLLLLVVVTDLMRITDAVSYANVKGFYREEKDSIDVALIGPSEFYTGYSAALAWEQFGYTSYALSEGGMPGSLYKSMLKEYLKQQSPKVVVFEINGFLYGEDYYKRSGKLHTWLDNISWSKNKIETIEEIIPEEEQYSYYFELASSHMNWRYPDKWLSGVAKRLILSQKETFYGKGFSTFSKRADVSKPKQFKAKFTEQSQHYLNDLLQYCKSQNLENVLFVRFPHAKEFADPDIPTQIEAVVESYGYDFLNLNDSYEEIGLDRKTDFYNREHLNIDGMEKMTAYFGAYLCDRYEVKGSHTKQQEEHWNTCAEKMHQLIKQCRQDMERGEEKHYWEMDMV